jgi:endo-1,4-beta-xylanase
VLHDMRVRGHTLLWHHPRWFPRWTESHDYGAQPAREVERLITTHINETCRRYPQVFEWDVINEAVDDQTGVLRDTVFSRHFGGPEATMDLTFHAAKTAAPSAQLMYNDYMSWEAGHENHRAGVLRLLEGFKRRGVPIDGLGVQSHIGSGNADNSVGFDTAQEREWRRFIDEVVGMGLKITITEFDVHDKNLPLDIPTRDAAVAELGGRYLDMMLSYPQLDGIVCWGLSDKYSWLQENWVREDGQPKRPCPYDDAMQAKPLRAAIAASLKAASPR